MRRVIGTTTFGYDWADRLVSANLPDGFSTAVPTFAWRADGLIKSRTYDTGTAVGFTYDRAKRLATIAKGSWTLSQGYDRNGNVTTESRSLGFSGDAGAGTQTFNYDELNRVVSSTGLGTGHNFTYEYDLDGNRTKKADGTTTWTYGFDRTDQLSSVNGGPSAVGYNAFGDMTTKPEDDASTTTYAYDLGGKLTAIGRAGTADDASFTFDALGRFRTRVLASSTDTYSYLGTTETVERISNSVSGAVDSILTSAGDRLGVDAGSTMNWFLPDPHGSIAASLSASETQVVNAIRYDAWGDTLLTGSGGGTAVGADAFKYQGRLDLSPSGIGEPLYDMSARFYSPSLGSFTQLDSVMGSAQNPLSMNRFLYAHANPATLIDPTGHKACGPDGIWCTGTNADNIEVGNSGGKVTPPKKPKKAKHGPNPNHAKDEYYTPDYFLKGYVPPSNNYLQNLRDNDVDGYNAYVRSYGATMWSWLSGTRNRDDGQLDAAAHSETLFAIDHFALNVWGNWRWSLSGHGVASGLGNWISAESAYEYQEVAELAGDNDEISASRWVVWMVLGAWAGNDQVDGVRVGSDRPTVGRGRVEPEPGYGEGGSLYRWGESRESRTRLERQAQRAENEGLPHGVSVADRPRGYDESRASRIEVERLYPVLKTGKDPNHFTLVLPKPVTRADAVRFNNLFGRHR